MTARAPAAILAALTLAFALAACAPVRHEQAVVAEPAYDPEADAAAGCTGGDGDGIGGTGCPVD